MSNLPNMNEGSSSRNTAQYIYKNSYLPLIEKNLNEFTVKGKIDYQVISDADVEVSALNVKNWHEIPFDDKINALDDIIERNFSKKIVKFSENYVDVIEHLTSKDIVEIESPAYKSAINGMAFTLCDVFISTYNEYGQGERGTHFAISHLRGKIEELKDIEKRVRNGLQKNLETDAIQEINVELRRLDTLLEKKKVGRFSAAWGVAIISVILSTVIVAIGLHVEGLFHYTDSLVYFLALAWFGSLPSLIVQVMPFFIKKCIPYIVTKNSRLIKFLARFVTLTQISLIVSSILSVIVIWRNSVFWSYFSYTTERLEQIPSGVVTGLVIVAPVIISLLGSFVLNIQDSTSTH